MITAIVVAILGFILASVGPHCTWPFPNAAAEWREIGRAGIARLAINLIATGIAESGLIALWYRPREHANNSSRWLIQGMTLRGEFIFIISEQQDCYFEGFDLPLHLLQLLLLST